MARRVLGAAVPAELHAFEAVDRCCAEALADYRRACDDIDDHRSRALRAVRAGDLRGAVSHARLEREAEGARRAAWAAYREACALLTGLVARSSEMIAADREGLAIAG